MNSSLGFASEHFPQQPSYFILGEEEFKGIQIYDVIQDNNDNYIFSTNEGLVYYDHYTYEKIVCHDSRSSSYFYFTNNSKGEIFCINLNRQVFKITDKKCEVFFEVSEEDANSFMAISVTKNDEIIIACNVVFLVDDDGNIIQKLDEHKGICGAPYQLNNDDIIFSFGTDSLIVCRNGVLSYEKLTHQEPEVDQAELFNFFEVSGKLFGIKNKSKAFFQIDYQSKLVEPINCDHDFNEIQAIRIYKTKNHIWLAGTLPGVFILDYKNDQIITKQYYDNIYISDVFEDNENSIILSTFDQGALVIPDMSISDNFISFQDEPITCLKKINEDQIVFGTSKGKVGIIHNDSVQIIQHKGNRPINVIVTDKNLDYIIYDDGSIKAYNTKTNQITSILSLSLKDGLVLQNKEILLATNSGLMRLMIQSEDKFEIKSVQHLNLRNYALTTNEDETVVYISTLNGLFLYHDNQVEEIKYHNESIFSSYLTFHNGRLYAIHSQSLIYLINPEGGIQKFSLEINNEPINIYEIKFLHDLAYINSSRGLLIYNTETRKTTQLSPEFRIPKRHLLDFEIQQNNLWISSSNMFKKIDLNYNDKVFEPPTISLSKIEVNDQDVSDSIKNFKSHQRKIVFELSSPTLVNKNEITYHYKLEGYDNNWHINAYFDNIIVYNSLPSGNFIFKYFASNGNLKSEIYSYHFSIEYPFYQRIWFILLIIATFLLIVYSVYRRQLKIQKIKAKQLFELNASKLTAIQSQMNPHFIFNSLNSIQDLVLKGDIEHSYTYITTFSNLVRRTLNYSDKDFIDFEQEVKLIELYLSLEKLRFKHELNFEINTNKINDIQIPPMLIQPFIENALVHGLLHKKGNKYLSISFSLNDSIYCVIKDNGIGRKKAGEIRDRQKKDYESFSVNAIKKRFEILSDYYQGEIGYHYEDLYENEEAIGTMVTLKIPFKNKF